MNSVETLPALELEKESSRLPGLNAEWPYLLACGLVSLLCIIAAFPIANSGFIDDFSYADVALRLARTGQFHYSGWGSPSVLFQSAWAAIWIRFFGFSFNLLRVATVPFSVGFVLLTYILGRKVGLSKEFALFASLTVAASPLYLPLACSFMTEPYACLLTLAAIYAALCSADAQDTGRAKMWLWVSTIASLLGGSDRQSVWVTPIVLIPYLLWKRRSERSFRIHGLIAYAACLVSLLLVLKYFSPPYAPMVLSRNQLLRLLISGWFTITHRISAVFLAGLFMTLPAFLGAVRVWRQLTFRQFAAIALLCIPGFLIVRIGKIGLVPFLGAILTNYGVLPIGLNGLGLKPMLLSMPVRNTLTYLFVLVLALWAYAIWKRQLTIDLSRSAAIVFLLSICSYIPVLVPGAMTAYIYDRYILPFLPLMIIGVLLSVQSATKRIPVAAYVCLAIFATYAVVTSHDYYSDLRARAIAAEDLQKRGIPQNRMSIGFEYDGWTQLRTTGHMATVMYNDDWRKVKFLMWLYATAVRPDYVAFASRLNDRVHNQILEVPFTAWTAPFHRKISIVKQADLPDSALDRNPEH